MTAEVVPGQWQRRNGNRVTLIAEDQWKETTWTGTHWAYVWTWAVLPHSCTPVTAEVWPFEAEEAAA